MYSDHYVSVWRPRQQQRWNERFVRFSASLWRGSSRCLLGSEILASGAIDFDYARKRATREAKSNYSASAVA